MSGGKGRSHPFLPRRFIHLSPQRPPVSLHFSLLLLSRGQQIGLCKIPQGIRPMGDPMRLPGSVVGIARVMAKALQIRNQPGTASKNLQSRRTPSPTRSNSFTAIQPAWRLFPVRRSPSPPLQKGWPWSYPIPSPGSTDPAAPWYTQWIPQALSDPASAAPPETPPDPIQTTPGTHSIVPWLHRHP